MSKEVKEVTREESDIKAQSGTVLQDVVNACESEEPKKMTEQEIALKVSKLNTVIQLSLGMLDSFEHALVPGNPENDDDPFKQVKASTFRNEDRDLISERLLSCYKEVDRLLSM